MQGCHCRVEIKCYLCWHTQISSVVYHFEHYISTCTHFHTQAFSQDYNVKYHQTLYNWKNVLNTHAHKHKHTVPHLLNSEDFAADVKRWKPLCTVAPLLPKTPGKRIELRPKMWSLAANGPIFTLPQFGQENSHRSPAVSVGRKHIFLLVWCFLPASWEGYRDRSLSNS